MSRRDPGGNRSAERVGGAAPRSDAPPLLLSVKQIGNTLASTDALSEYTYSLLVRLRIDLADGCGELGDEPFNRPPGSLVGDLADRGTERGDLSVDLALQIPECGSVSLDLDAQRGHFPSLTVVPGWRRAVASVTKRPVLAER